MMNVFVVHIDIYSWDKSKPINYHRLKNINCMCIFGDTITTNINRNENEKKNQIEGHTVNLKRRQKTVFDPLKDGKRVRENKGKLTTYFFRRQSHPNATT